MRKETSLFVWSLVGLVLALFNMLDCYYTLQLLSYGGYEANPVMAWLLDLHPYWFISYKVGVVNVCFLFLGRIAGNHSIARYALGLGALLYVPVVLWSAYVHEFIILGTNV